MDRSETLPPSADELVYEPYEAPSGGWGSVRSLATYAGEPGAARAAKDMLVHQNKPDGFMCVSCAWAKPAKPHVAEFCENGGKATFWELTGKRTTPAFFARHTLTELRDWSDHALEDEGRLTHPMRYDAASDKYVETTWEEAAAAIGAKLRTLAPKSVIFYASGRASLETTYMYQLFARLYGSNNLPDSSNMCHETTSTALPKSIGVPVGTVLLEDFDQTECILSFGQNVGTNAPRMLHQLQEARKRDVPILVFNPLRERGWEKFVNPQSPLQMVATPATDIATRYHQLKTAGDIAAIAGLAKALLQMDDAQPVLDHRFIAEHTHGFEAFAGKMRSLSWAEIEAASGLERHDLEATAAVYANAKSAMAVYGMGLTQHPLGEQSIQMLVNLLLMKGNIGKPGAGICPVRGHSNVQGQRTVGMTEKVKLAPLDKLAELYHFEPLREDGLATVESCEGILDGSVKAFIGLGGNFARAVPDRTRLEPAWEKMALSVQVATKLNRTHLLPAEMTWLLPCLGRIEIDRQESGPQIVTMEDSTARIHASHGVAPPAAETLRSEPWIVAALAKATLKPNPNVPWDAWVANYGIVREQIEKTYPDQFADFNERMDQPGGFARPLPARNREWKTETGKANFIVPEGLRSVKEESDPQGVLRLMTVRSNDQFNTTVYGYDDRFRGISGSRMVVMMNEQDMAAAGIADRDMVRIETISEDGRRRVIENMRALAYNVPEGCCAAYFPECNDLLPLDFYAEGSKTPAAKSIPVRVSAMV